MRIPKNFEIETFELWYNFHFKTKINLKSSVDKILDNIGNSFTKKYSINKRETTDWSQILTFVNDLIGLVRITNSTLNYDIVPSQQGINKGDFKRFFLKSTNSVINKMWRKAKSSSPTDCIKVENLTSEMKDLIRFSIKTNTLNNSQIIAEAFQNIIETPPKQLSHFLKDFITEIKIDEEMKTDSGYFAYHIYLKVKSEYTVEVQLYSILSDTWRELSHKIYDKVRDLDEAKYQFNDIKSRIVSIGHLLYLADCELYNLEQELKKV